MQDPTPVASKTYDDGLTVTWYKLADEHDSLPDPTTTSGRRIHGPAMVEWREDNFGIKVNVYDADHAVPELA